MEGRVGNYVFTEKIFGFIRVRLSMDLGSRKRTTLSQGRKPSVSGVCSPFQERHFGAGKDGKHLRTVPLQLDRMPPHEIC